MTGGEELSWSGEGCWPAMKAEAPSAQGEVAFELPAVIHAKVHGASVSLPSGRRGLIGGWNEHQRDGQLPFVDKRLVDRLAQAAQAVAAILQSLAARSGSEVTEDTVFEISGEDGTITVGQALDAADAALAAIKGGAA